MRLLGSTKKDIDKDKNSENVPKLESAEVVLVHCNLVKNDCQHTSKVLFSFVRNKQFGQLTLFRMGEGGRGGGGCERAPPTSFSHVTSTNVGIGP